MPAATTTQPYDWLKQISPTLLENDSIPLMGFPPEFLWKQFSAKIAELFKLNDLVIQPVSALEWRSEDDLLSGLGDAVEPLQFAVAPLNGCLWWMMAEQDVVSLMSLLLTHQTQLITSLDADFQQGFYKYIALETLHAISQLDFDKELSGRLLQKTSEPAPPSLCLDISITVQQKTGWGRLVFSPELQQSWKERYGRRTLAAPLSPALNLIVHLEVGRTNMTLAEWSQVSLGDFIILDSCSGEPHAGGYVMLTASGVSLFRGELKDGGIEILEHPLHQEVNETMGKEIPNDETEEEEEEEEQEESSFFGDDDEDEDANEDEKSEMESGEEDALIEEKWPPPPELAPRASRAMRSEKELHAEEDEEHSVVEKGSLEEDAQPLTLEEIPVSVVVEIGRLRMTVQKLLDLRPGNLLELNVRPENGVDLVVNGQRIAKAELLRIGDVLGVRILDKG